jgi:predicted DNA-binding transcriptional regulator YafY
VKELAEEFGVSSRTMLRDLQELSGLGIPLYSEVGPNGGYRVLQNRMLPPITFTENEAVAMFFACQSLELYSSLPFEAESHSALKKFFHFLPEDTKQKIESMKDRVLFWTPTRDQKSPHLKELLDASIRQEVLSVRYDSEHGETSREILPFGLYSANGFWYCPSYCFLRKAMRLFRADRFSSVKPAENVKLPNDFEHLTINKVMEWDREESGRRFPLKVELTRNGVRRCQSEGWLGKQISVRDDGSGWIESEIDEREIDYVADFFFGFGKLAKLLQPDAAIHMIRERIETMRRLYEN